MNVDLVGEPGAETVRLTGVFHSIRPRGPLPAKVRFVLLLMMSSARGRHVFRIEVFHLVDSEKEISIATAPELTISLGSDPLRVVAAPITLPPVEISSKGGHEFRLYCDGRLIASEYFLVKG